MRARSATAPSKPPGFEPWERSSRRAASRLESIRGVGSKSSARIRNAAKRLENDARRGLKDPLRHRKPAQRADQSSECSSRARRSAPKSQATEAQDSKRPSSASTQTSPTPASRPPDSGECSQGHGGRSESRAALERMVEFLNEPDTSDARVRDGRHQASPGEIPQRPERRSGTNTLAQAATYNGLLAEIEGLEPGPRRRESRRGHPRRESLAGIEGLEPGPGRQGRRRVKGRRAHRRSD